MRGGPGAPLGSSPPTHCCEQHRRGPWSARQRYWRANFWSGLRGGVREAAADLGVLCGGTQLPRVYRTPRSAHPPLFLPTKQPRPRRTKVSVTERSQFRLCKRGSSQMRARADADSGCCGKSCQPELAGQLTELLSAGGAASAPQDGPRYPSHALPFLTSRVTCASGRFLSNHSVHRASVAP